MHGSAGPAQVGLEGLGMASFPCVGMESLAVREMENLAVYHHPAGYLPYALGVGCQVPKSSERVSPDA